MFEQEDIDAKRMRSLGLAPDPRVTRWMASTQDCVKLLSPEGEITYMSRNGLCAMEIDDLQAILGKSWWSLWPEESRALVRQAVETARRDGICRFEAACPTAKGDPARWAVTVTAVPDADGAVREILSVSRRIG